MTEAQAETLLTILTQITVQNDLMLVEAQNLVSTISNFLTFATVFFIAWYFFLRPLVKYIFEIIDL
jgi:hypothetical protein